MNATDTLIRSLDPATQAPDPEIRRRLDAGLEDIVATPRERDTQPRRTHRALTLATAASLAALTAALWPGLADRDSGSAYASWTPHASTLTASDTDRVAELCRRSGRTVGEDPTDPAWRLILGERRGDFGTVVLVNASANRETVVSCTARFGTDGSVRLNGSGATSGPSPRPLPANGFREESASESEVPGGPHLRTVVGTVGTAVTGVTLHTARGEVEATVADGHFVAWWPQRADSWLLSYDLTLADGTVIKDASTAR